MLIGVPSALGLAPFVFFLSFIPYYGVLRILLAYYLLGLKGAFLALPLAAMVKVMVSEIQAARRKTDTSAEVPDGETTPPGDEVGLGTA